MWSWDILPNSHTQRKFIELILDRTGKYPNWDPPSEIPVGSLSTKPRAILSSKALYTQMISSIIFSMQVSTLSLASTFPKNVQI